jgi:predicted Zn-dependent peptidase
MPAPEISPVFIDYSTDLLQDSIAGRIPLLYKQNTENNTFNLYYVFEMGTDNDRRLELAISYLEYLGTSKFTPAQMKEEFYKLACSFSVYSSADQVYVSLSGLSDNFEKALALFEEFLSDLQQNINALDNLIKDILKVRADNKLSQETILWDAMFSYAKYGPKSTYTNILSENELKSIKPDELIDLLKDLLNHEHKIVYYGPEKTDDLKRIITERHFLPSELKPVPDRVIFPELSTDENKIYVVNYDGMVQSEILMLSKCGTYDKTKAPIISLYNEYFGSGMSGIVFQELRESKALAYATFASYSTPQRKDLSHYIWAYIGTQSDKFPEAMEGLFNILNNMPESEVTYSMAKNSVVNQIKTSRTTRASVLFSYLSAQKLGLDYDIKKDVYYSVQGLSLQDIVKFQQENVKNKKYTILVLGDKSKLDINILEKYGQVKFLTLEEIFGY